VPPEDGLVVVVKRDCPTCHLVSPVLAALPGLTVWSQDDPAFPAGLDVGDDRDLDVSVGLDIETVPTLIRYAGGVETGRTVGWSRAAWRELTGVDDLGADLPEHRPGCGSRTLDPDVVDDLLVRRRGHLLRSRHVEVAALEDEAEAMFDRGLTDGLPVVTPTPVRVLRMLAGTSHAPDEIVATVPPNLVPVTVEKIAVNAVMAGCRPEYLPVVLAAVAAACSETFNAHGVLATMWNAGPAILVNGPVAAEIGMNSKGNVLGQGNRANSTIGRALQLVIRNVGGGVPGGVDRATFGNPGKIGLCFAEDEAGSPWEPLSVSRGFAPGTSTVTVFAAEGPVGILEQLSRTPESITRSLASTLRVVGQPKTALFFDATLLVGPEHARIYAEAGWDRTRVLAALDEALLLDRADIERGAHGIEDGMPPGPEPRLPKFRPGGLLLAHAGANAGQISTILGGWVGGPAGSSPTTLEVDPWR
jgi:hypothetical protein